MIADTHSDLLLELSHREHALGERDVFARTWLPLLEAGGVGLQVCAVYVDIGVPPEDSLREALREIASFHRALRESPDRLVHVRDGADLDAVEAGERIGLLLSLEGAEPFGAETWPAEVFHGLGLRIAGLTWNRSNAFAAGAAGDGGGLSRLGRDLVDRLVELGVVLDVAHASPGTFADILKRARGAPVMCSHGACRAVYDTPRNLDDEQLRRLGDAGGLLGMMFLPLAVDSAVHTIDRVVDHLEHACDVMGPHAVCLGGDFIRRLYETLPLTDSADGLRPPGLEPGAAVDGLAGPEDYPRLVAALRRRGWSDAQVAGVTSRNLVRFLRATL